MHCYKKLGSLYKIVKYITIRPQGQGFWWGSRVPLVNMHCFLKYVSFSKYLAHKQSTHMISKKIVKVAALGSGPPVILGQPYYPLCCKYMQL